MNVPMTEKTLVSENKHFRDTGGTSAENRCFGFRPAFKDNRSGAVYVSCFADGRPAPFHLLDGLPDEVVLNRNATGRAVSVLPSLISGFVRDGQFYTREEAGQQAMMLTAA